MPGVCLRCKDKKCIFCFHCPVNSKHKHGLISIESPSSSFNLNSFIKRHDPKKKIYIVICYIPDTMSNYVSSRFSVSRGASIAPDSRSRAPSQAFRLLLFCLMISTPIRLLTLDKLDVLLFHLPRDGPQFLSIIPSQDQLAMKAFLLIPTC